MPKLRYRHAAMRSIPREQDIGYLITEARSVGLYVRPCGSGRVELQATKSKHILFAGSVPQAVAFLKNR